MDKLFTTLRRTVVSALISTIMLPAAFAQNTGGKVPGYAQSDISDLALIYQGGKNRIGWTPDQIEPYVTHRFADGTEDWLFDGFLFLEFQDGTGYEFAHMQKLKPARKIEWQTYLNRLFEQGKSLHALDKVIGEKKKSLGDPGFRHKVVITIPVPFEGQTDWGKIDGRSLNFNKKSDREKALKWYMDSLLKLYKAQNFENFDLYGLYWIDETMAIDPHLTPYVSKYLHRKGLKFFWIPYYGATGHADWKKYGFDIAYYQPNVLFNEKGPISRIDDAAKVARENGMGVEFEADERALSGHEGWGDRMQAYIDGFDRNDLWNQSALAYYTGSALLYEMTRDPSPSNQRLADELARRIISRHKKLKK